ncbi:MAG: hypothetical protein AAF376_03805 [Pseudomonadota bacterium]
MFESILEGPSGRAGFRELFFQQCLLGIEINECLFVAGDEARVGGAEDEIKLTLSAFFEVFDLFAVSAFSVIGSGDADGPNVSEHLLGRLKEVLCRHQRL